MAIRAKVIADSISPIGDRLTTLECTFHRFILSEFNTHRKFSRNSASSRAIPVNKIINQVIQNPAIPITFPKEQPGMVGGEDLNEMDRESAEELWIAAGDSAVETAKKLIELGVHKSVINRLLEPFMWHTVVVSSTEWDNFLSQRISGAQPEMMELAAKINSALEGSVPTAVDYGDWHLPYITQEELNPYRSDLNDEMRRQLSVARVAGSSYNRLGQTRELEKDLGLYERLRHASPPHWSPFEHVATPSELIMPGAIEGNFDGWHQLRHIVARNG